MWQGAKSSTQRSRDLRARRRRMGLRELRVWVTKEDESIAKKIMDTFERAALAESIQERNEAQEENIKLALEEFHRWTNKRNIPMEKKFSTRRQRLFAYQLSRAAQIPLPSDLIFTDYHLMKDWICKTVNKYSKVHQVQSFLDELKRCGLD
ncbi:MAG: hypothetical protein Q7V63_02450 [Gammaproteobacteria bacterium]|nr:hypothetical protein [Gammaproteobacteria bacterium]